MRSALLVQPIGEPPGNEPDLLDRSAAVVGFDHKRLDLRALMEGKASDPKAWPDPFTDDGSKPVFWTEVEPGHYVRISREDA